MVNIEPVVPRCPYMTVHARSVFVLLLLCVSLKGISGQSFEPRDVSLIGCWPFGPPVKGIAINETDHIAYFSSGAGVYVLDIVDPAHPILVSEAIHASDIIADLYFEDSILFIAAGASGVEIWNVCRPDSPRFVSALNTPGSANKVRKLNSNLYVADGDSGLRIISISDIMNPHEICNYYTGGYSRYLGVKPGYAFLVDMDYGIRIIDVSDSTNPSVVSTIHDSDYHGVAVQGDYLYVAVYAFARGLDIYDITDIFNPQLVGSVDTMACFEIAVEGDFAYTVASMKGVYVVDIFDVHNPQQLGNYSDLCLMNNIAYHNGYVYVPDKEQFLDLVSRLQCVNVEDPLNPYPDGHFSTPGFGSGMHTAWNGRFNLIANYRGGLRIVSIADIENPREVANYPGLAWQIIGDVKAYPCGGQVMAVMAADDSVAIVDVTDPANPQFVGSCSGLLFGYIWALDIEKKYNPGLAWVMSSDFYCCNLHQVSISSPGAPHIVSDSAFYDRVGYDIYWANYYVYVAAGSAGLRIHHEYYFYEYGYYDTPGSAHGVYVVDYLAYVADSSGGLRIINVADAYNPQEIGACVSAQCADKVYVTGSRAFVAALDSGVYVIDVSDPTNPQELAHFYTIDPAIDISGRGDTICVLTHSAGFYFYVLNAIGCEDDYIAVPLSTPYLAIQPIFCRNEISGHLRLPYHTPVTLSLYDLLGRKIRCFTEVTMDQGEHNFSFSTNGIAQGVYFLVLSTENFSVTQKAIIIH